MRNDKVVTVERFVPFDNVGIRGLDGGKWHMCTNGFETGICDGFRDSAGVGIADPVGELDTFESHIRDPPDDPREGLIESTQRVQLERGTHCYRPPVSSRGPGTNRSADTLVSCCGKAAASARKSIPGRVDDPL